WGSLFDPEGDDEIPLNGDEGLQITGYYYTHNFMTAMATFQTVLQTNIEALIGYYFGLLGDLGVATVAGADSAADEATQAALVAIGATPTLAAGIGALIGAAVGDLVTVAGDPDTLEVAGEALLVQVLGMALAGGFDPDDSDHDYNPTDGNGRLLFEVDNNCIPTQQTREVYGLFVNVETLGIDSDVSTLPDVFAVHGNYPNPFNPTTEITFDLPAQLATEVTVWNLLGQRVQTAHAGVLPAGTHSVTFSGRDATGESLPSGVYFYRVEAGQYISTRKMMLLK
ncbi:MAG: T9SS type A sorting domain-containing protein, partial [Candidatus Neomarinimicrobiota bacterium]